MRIVTISLILLLLLAPWAAHAAEEVHIYSARKEALIKPLLERFTAATGTPVRLVTGKADALIERLRREGRNSPADLLLTVDAARLHRAKEGGLLRSVSSELLSEAVPEQYRDPQGLWYGLSLRARTIMYNKAKITPAELSSYEDLADRKWRGQICIRSSSNVYNQSLVASMIAANGVKETQEWAKGVVRNMARPPRGGDRDQIKAAASGRCALAIANTYYLGKMMISSDRSQQRAAAQVGVFWPNQTNRGVHVNVSGAGVTANADNPEGALQLLEFLVSAESQSWYAEVNQEYPVREGVTSSELLRSWGEFKADTLSLSRLGELNAEAVRSMDRARWR